MFAQVVYHTIRFYVYLALRFYFRKWQIHGKENIPKNASVIYVVNHQNAFLDAILIACATKDEPWFLTRAGVFGNAFARTVLHWFHMMPVYRFRDGWKSLRNNDTTIRQCVDILNSKGSILLFVEGDQGLRWQLRSLQKGFARIALAAQQENNWKLPLYLVPVGVQYDHHYNFRSRVLINYGKPVSIDASYQSLPEREFLDTLVEIVKTKLKPLMLHVESVNYEAIEQYVRQNRKRDLVEQLTHNQLVADKWEAKPHSSNEREGVNYFLLLLPLPLYVYVLINNFLPYILTSWLLKKYVTLEFKGSLKLAFGMVITPLFYVVQSILVQNILHDWRITMGYFVTLPFISVWMVDLFKSATRNNQ